MTLYFDCVRRVPVLLLLLTAAACTAPTSEFTRRAAALNFTAALVRGAVNAPEVPESVQSQSRAQGLTLLAEAPARPIESPSPSPTWLGRLGSAIQVAFNLIKRR